MDISPVLDLLRQRIGLNPESIGTVSVEKTVRERIEMSGAASAEDYVRKINCSAAELDRLVESVVVQETSFFRNATPFITLQSYLKQFVLNKERGRPLRILCFPCSTGEEAYSIAMVLFDMKLSANQFFIFAGDISEQALQIAEAGRYSSYSFRGKDIAFREKYFTKQPDGSYILKQEVRDAVHFERDNILSGNFLPGHQPYDVIFCRNLLIYFDDAAKVKAINFLSGHLSEEGVLFVGHAEGASIHQFGLMSLDYPMSFAFARKKYATSINDALNIINPVNRSPAPPVPVQRKANKDRFSIGSGKIIPVTSESGQNGENERISRNNLADSRISTARQLAVAGSFNEVASICEKLLSEGAENAEIYYLLGWAADSAKDDLLAEEYLIKAIYLDADSYDALVLLSRLYDRMGIPEKSSSFRRRAERVKSRNKGAADK